MVAAAFLRQILAKMPPPIDGFLSEFSGVAV
jgi:hypothetical protein